MERFRLAECFTDVTINGYHLHKIILASKSVFFENLLLDGRDDYSIPYNMDPIIAAVYRDEHPTCIKDFITVYETGIDVELDISLVANTFDYTLDINILPTNTIIQLFTSAKFVVRNLIRFYQTIKGLVDKGHPPSLYSLINYKIFPNEVLSKLPYGFTDLHSGGILPKMEENTYVIINDGKGIDRDGNIKDIRTPPDAGLNFCDVVTLYDADSYVFCLFL